MVRVISGAFGIGNRYKDMALYWNGNNRGLYLPHSDP
jgi:hypothetical protein